MIRNQIRLNERVSLNRPAWTSEPPTGGLQAFRHLHIGKKDIPIVRNYFDRTKGLIK